MNLGRFARRGRYLTGSTASDLPEGLDFANLAIRQFAPGITVLVAQFGIEKSQRNCLREILEREFSTRAFPIKNSPGGHSIHHPIQLKQDAIGQVRSHYRDLGREWIGKHVPGFFTSTDSLEQPAWDLVVTENHSLLSDQPHRSDWRDVLGLGWPVEEWRSDRLPTLKLLTPRMNNEGNVVPTFTATSSEAIALLEGQHSGDDLDSFVHYLNRQVMDLLGLWAVEKALTEHGRRFSTIRDDLAEPTGLRAAGKRVRRLRNEVLPLAFDLETLEDAASNDFALQMQPRYSNVDFKLITPNGSNELKGPPERSTLFGALQSSIRRRGVEVAAQAREITSGVRLQGELLLATTNVRLQWAVLILTVFVGVVGFARSGA